MVCASRMSPPRTTRFASKLLSSPVRVVPVFDANAPEDIIRFSTIGCSAFANQMIGRRHALEEFVAHFP